jgi:hypothetical protein
VRTFITGFGAGVTLALLTAPDSGRNVRGALLRRVRSLVRRDFAGDGAAYGSFEEEQGERHSESTSSGDPMGEDHPLNTVTREAILGVYGIGPKTADRILVGRPYASEQDFLSRNLAPQSVCRKLLRELRRAA